MMATDVYVETSISAPQEKKRKWGYVLEAPGGRTVYQLGEMTGTMHGITLQVLIKALRRYQKPSRITIHQCKRGVDQIPEWLGAAGKFNQNTYNHDRSGTARVQCLATERDGENGKREIGCLRDLGK